MKPRAGFGEARIEDWQSAGLLKPSMLKPILFTGEKTIIARMLGRLKASDQEALRKTISAILG